MTLKGLQALGRWDWGTIGNPFLGREGYYATGGFHLVCQELGADVPEAGHSLEGVGSVPVVWSGRRKFRRGRVAVGDTGPFLLIVIRQVRGFAAGLR